MVLAVMLPVSPLAGVIRAASYPGARVISAS